MITLDLKRLPFDKNEKWPLLYVIADVYANKASKSKPLTDVDAVDLLKTVYGLEVERRTIKKYRDYLERYFGYSFKTLNKGKYLETPWEIDVAATREKDFLARFKEYCPNQGETHDIARKIGIILTAQKEKRYLSVGIKNYIVFLNPKSRSSKSIGVRRANLLVAPIEVFRYKGQHYLLSYLAEEKQYYIHLIKSLIVKPNSISSQRWDRHLGQVDLADYLKKQDFVFTGPINLFAKEYYFSYTEGEEQLRDVSLCCTRTKHDAFFPFPYLLQSLIDLYGPHAGSYPIDKYSLGIFFPNDWHADSILSKNKHSWINLVTPNGEI